MKVLMKGIMIVLTLMAIILAGIAFVPVAPYEPDPRQLRAETAFKLDEKVGWYRTPDDNQWLITWGAENGLTINRFDPLARGYLTPTSADTFAWRNRRGEEKFRLSFTRNNQGKTSGIAWLDEKGDHHSGVRLEDYLYDQAEIFFSNEKIKLAGTLMRPVSAGPHPAVVFIHGSGVSDRNNLWYLHIANYLAKHGITVLFPDKRGCGKSGGEWHIASFDDFAKDALAGVNFLRGRDSVDPRRIGIIGFSQGGWIAPLAASNSSNVNFVVNVAGAAVTPNEQIEHEVAADIRNSGVPAAMAAVMAPAFAKRAKNRRSLWWQKNGDFDPMPYWSSLAIPINIVYGKKDEDDNVPVGESLVRLQGAKRKSNNPNFVIKVYEDSGHAIEDPKAATRLMRKDYLDSLVQWIRAIGDLK